MSKTPEEIANELRNVMEENEPDIKQLTYHKWKTQIDVGEKTLNFSVCKIRDDEAHDNYQVTCHTLASNKKLEDAVRQAVRYSRYGGSVLNGGSNE